MNRVVPANRSIESFIFFAVSISNADVPSSTNSIFIEEKTKREFVFANMIRSLKVYQSIVISERTEFRCEPIKSGRKD